VDDGPSLTARPFYCLWLPPHVAYNGCDKGTRTPAEAGAILKNRAPIPPNFAGCKFAGLKPEIASKSQISFMPAV